MTRPSDNIKQIAQLMAELDLCMLTTHTSSGGLHTRPMSNNGEVEFDGDVWFFSSRESRKVREITADPDVLIGYSSPEDGLWLALEGRAEIVTDVEQKKALWLDELDRWFPDGPEDEHVVLIKVHAHRAERWGSEEGVVELE